MAAFGDRIQALMDEVYTEWQKEENKGKSKWDVLGGYSAVHQIAVVFGNFNNQVENGGISQWIYNGYFHDDAEKLTEYLEIGAESDERCRTILDRVYKLDQYAQETECDRDGYFNDEEGDSSFIGDMINSDAFDTWYYANCGEDNWWQVVCGIIDTVEEREPAPDRQDEHGGEITDTAIPPLRVYIENVHDESIGGFTIPLPARLAEFQGFLEASEITGWQDMEILNVKSDIAGLGELLTEVTLKTMSPTMLDELNYLAAKIEDMHPSEYEVFAAVMEAKRHCNTVAELINLTGNLDRFELQPAFDAAMLGEHLLDGDADNHSSGFQKLYESTDEELRGIIIYIETLEKYIDYSAYGKEYAEANQGVFTENGYLTEKGEFKEVYRGAVDIPDDSRIFTETGVTYRFPMKLDGADIAETLVKIHALCSLNMNGAADEIKMLSQGHDRDYLLMVNKDRIFVAPAIEAYKRGELAEGTIRHWAQILDTSVFALRVMDRDEDNGRIMKGDFVELNVKALLSNMARHAVTPDRVEAFKHDGYSKSYDFAAWEELSKTPQYDIKSFTAHFPDHSLGHAEKQLASFLGANEMSSEAVSIDTFLSVMNATYMAAAENPQPDMLRIANDAAKQILARGDTEVFKLTPDGAVKLEPIEAMRQLTFAQITELAIKHEDVTALDKWAKNAVNDIQRKSERDERRAAKDKREEL